MSAKTADRRLTHSRSRWTPAVHSLSTNSQRVVRRTWKTRLFCRTKPAFKRLVNVLLWFHLRSGLLHIITFQVWDTVRMVRCLWEGSIKQDLSVSLVIGMLAQEVVTFSGDTGRARLDIQVGRGPFAPAANGLVKIGEIMTLVVYVEGDPGFDVVVRQCQARDTAGTNSIQLFDERGCVLKPKLFGAFQKTRETGNTGASVIAYAFFSVSTPRVLSTAVTTPANDAFLPRRSNSRMKWIS